MDNKEVKRVLEELQEVRPEKLTGDAKRLFEAIMKIADARDKAEADLYEANNRINDLLDIEKQKDKIIDEMANTMSAICTGIVVVREQFEKQYCEFITSNEDCCWKTDKSCADCIKEYFEERCKNAKD